MGGCLRRALCPWQCVAEDTPWLPCKVKLPPEGKEGWAEEERQAGPWGPALLGVALVGSEHCPPPHDPAGFTLFCLVTVPDTTKNKRNKDTLAVLLLRAGGSASHIPAFLQRSISHSHRESSLDVNYIHDCIYECTEWLNTSIFLSSKK